MIKCFVYLILLIPATAMAQQFMVDRPGQLLDLAQELATNIQTAENIRNEMLTKIKAGTAKLKEINRRLKNPSLTRARKLELQAHKNRLERNETKYRRQALAVVKQQMDHVFASLDKMWSEIENLKSEEPAVDPQVIEAFNRYLRVSAQLIKGSARGLNNVNSGTMSILATLEKSLLVSRQSTDFLKEASARLRQYQRLVAVYNAQLVYLAKALEKYSRVLANERDAITVVVSLETASHFMDELNIEEMEDSVLNGFSRRPGDFLTNADFERLQHKLPRRSEAKKALSRYAGGIALKEGD